MTLLFMEGFDDQHFAADADLGRNGWEALTGTFGTHMFFITNGGAFGTGCFQYEWSSTNPTLGAYVIDKAGSGFPTNQIRCAFWLRIVNWNFTFSTNYQGLVRWVDRAGKYWPIWFGANGAIIAGFFDDSTIVSTLASSSDCNLVDGHWHHIEMNLIADPSAGTCQIWVDEKLLIDVSGDTSNSASGDCTTLNTMTIRCPRSAGSTAGTDIEIDDIVIWNDTGTDFTGQLGFHRIEAKLPDGAGNYTDFTPSAGSNYQNVDEAGTPDDDTTYNESSAANDKDTFTVGNLSIANDVKGVSVKVYAKTTGTGTARAMIRSASTDATETTETMTTSYDTYRGVFEVDPNGSAAWSVSAFNSLEAGYEVIT